MKVFATLLLAGLALSCNKQPEPIPTESKNDNVVSGNAHGGSSAAPMASAAPMMASAAPMASAASAAKGPSDIAYDVPTAWTTAPNPSPMRKATFKIPKAGGESDDAELAVSSASGGVEPNIKRWEGQFGNAKAVTAKRTVNGLDVTTVEIKGKFGGGMMPGAPAAPAAAAPKDQMLLGAVVDGGDQQFFFKMIGGEKTVTASKKDFEKFVSSFRGK